MHLTGFGRYVYNNIKDAYRPLYDEITKSSDVELACNCGELNDKNEMKVTFKVGSQIINHFDMKQMICHLLAIGTAVLTNHYDEMKNANEEDIKLHFIYLILNAFCFSSIRSLVRIKFF